MNNNAVVSFKRLLMNNNAVVSFMLSPNTRWFWKLWCQCLSDSGSQRKFLLASLSSSLRRLRYVFIEISTLS